MKATDTHNINFNVEVMLHKYHLKVGDLGKWLRDWHLAHSRGTTLPGCVGPRGLDELSVGATFELEILPEVDHLKAEDENSQIQSSEV